MKKYTLRQATLALFATTGLFLNSASAAEFTVLTATIVKNGGAGNILDGNDTITITSAGSITTGASTAVDATNANNSVENFGAITTTGFAHGIRVNQLSKITNVGSITVNANNSVGVFAQNSNMILNSGTITTKGDNGWGIQFQNTNTVTNSGTITTQNLGARGISGNNSNTILNSGTITTAGNNAYGIEANNSNTLSNSGTIATGGQNTHGIFIDDTNTISNTGTITTSGNQSSGIAGNSSNTISNTGAINTSGLQSNGILVGGTNNTITNTGTINTTGGLANGIGLFASNNTAINSGVITVTGASSIGMGAAILGANEQVINNSGTINVNGGAAGIVVLSQSSVTNSGIINTSGNTAIGIFSNGNLNTLINSGKINTTGDSTSNAVFILGNGNKLTNQGSLSTAGAGSSVVAIQGIENTFTNSGTLFASSTSTSSHGVHLGDAGETVNNSGKIVSTAGAAILSTVGDSTFNFQAPSYFGGALSFQGSDIVNITTGRSHSNLWKIDGNPAGVGIMGPVPWAWDAATKQFATLDPTALSAAPSLLANKVNGLSDLTRYNTASQWWLQGYGNFSSQNADSIYNDFYNIEGGLAAGATASLNKNLDLGAMIGFSASSLVVNSKWVTSQTINSEGVNGAIYGTARMDDLFLDFALYAGGQSNSSDRFVNDNLEALGQDHALATFNSWFLAPEIRLGVNVQTDGEWTITPSASARLSSQWVDGYSETGSNANATIAAHLVQVLEGDIELAAMRKIDNGEITLKGGLTYQQNLGTGTQDIVLLGQTLAIPVNVAGILGGYVGVEGTYDINDNSTLNISAKAYYASNSSYGISGTMGIKSEF